VSIELKTRVGTTEFRVDEHLRRDATLGDFAKLKPAFKKDGAVTAGNASGVNDAAAAVVVMSGQRAQELGAPVRARIVSYAVCGVEPKTMGIGPVPAVRKALERAGKTLDDIDVIELNEGVRSPVPGGLPGPRARPCEGQPKRRSNRARPPDRRDRSDHHDQDPGGDGTQ
jgi:acetyl-CoA acetyltransferase